MRDKNKRTESKHVSVTESLNQMHITSADIVASVIVFGDVAATTEIV